MYSKERLEYAVHTLCPYLEQSELPLPRKVKETAVECFLRQHEDSNTAIVREALRDLHQTGCFRYTDEPEYLQSVPQGVWVPASGGTERVFTSRSGKRLLYCFNRTLGKHAYLDVDRDVILTDEEAIEALETGA